MLLTVVAGTTQTLYAHSTITGLASYPDLVLTAVDGTTRTNFAEVSGSSPYCSLVDENDSEIPGAFLPFYTYTIPTAHFYSTTNYVAQKFIINTSINIAGVSAILIRTGTPAGDVRVRIFDSSNNVISGTTLTIDKDSLTGVNAKSIVVLFPSVVTLTSGTYRIVFDSSGSANSSNAFGLRLNTFLNSAAVNPWRPSTSSDAITWTDSTTEQTGVWLLLDDFVSGGAGGVCSLIGGLIV